MHHVHRDANAVCTWIRAQAHPPGLRRFQGLCVWGLLSILKIILENFLSMFKSSFFLVGRGQALAAPLETGDVSGRPAGLSLCGLSTAQPQVDGAP